MHSWVPIARLAAVCLALALSFDWAALPAGALATSNNVDVVTRPAAASSGAPLLGRVIAVDPGHGGRDPGASANGVNEKAVTLGVGLALRQALLDLGATVVMTRTADVSVGLPDDPHDGLQVRSDFANAARANAFVSVHANAAPDAGRSGVITYFGQRCGYVSAAQRDPALMARSYRLATRVESDVAQASGEVNDGVDSADYWVLGNTNMPSILVETGFVTNVAEAARLTTPAYQKKVAQAIAAGVADFFAQREDQISLPPAPASSNKVADDSTFQQDVSIPDGAVLAPGASITKTWRVRNTGCTTWTQRYHLAFRGGEQMGGPASAPIKDVDPGGSLNLSVGLVVPASADGMGYWQMVDASGAPFGDKLWVRLGQSSRKSAVRAAPPPTTRAAPSADTAHASYYDATGHNVAFAFRTYFDRNGGLDRFGFPRTEELMENGLRVQYFQRARMEYHPEKAGTSSEVQLSLLGDWLTADQGPFPEATASKNSTQHVYFSQTGYAVSFGFLKYFNSHSGIDAFGYPVSNEMVQRDSQGHLHTVQYFQRARFEYHPEFAGTRYEVELGLLGDEYLHLRGWLP